MLLPIGDNLERPNFPLATVMLILINVTAFVITSKMELTGSNLMDTGEASEKMEEVRGFYDTWGCVPNLLQEGQLIGVLTHMFLHADIFHLIGNMLILWVFGQSLETALGGIAFVVMYVFWGAVACITHCAMDFSSEFFLIGASGAIAGVMGGYMTLFGFSARIKILLLLGPLPLTFFVPAGGFGFLWIMQQLYNASIDVQGAMAGVAWMAHVGGFMAGAATMWVFRNQTDQVVIADGERRYFGKRVNTDLKAAMGVNENDEHLNIDLDDESAFVDIQPRPCQYCDSRITKADRISERLLRCPNKKCQQLTYLTDDELRPSYVE